MVKNVSAAAAADRIRFSMPFLCFLTVVPTLATCHLPLTIRLLADYSLPFSLLYVLRVRNAHTHIHACN